MIKMTSRLSTSTFTHLKIASAADAEVSVEEVDTFAGIMDKVGITNPSLQEKLGLGEN